MKKSTPMQQMAMLRSSAVDFTLLTFVPVECTLIVSTFCSLIVFSSKPQKWHQPVGAPAPQKLITKYHSDFVTRRGRGCHLLTFTFSRIGFLAGNPDDQSTQWFWHFLNLSPPQFDDWCISGRMSAAQLQPLWFYFPLWQTDQPNLGQSTSTSAWGPQVEGVGVSNVSPNYERRIKTPQKTWDNCSRFLNNRTNFKSCDLSIVAAWLRCCTWLGGSMSNGVVPHRDIQWYMEIPIMGFRWSSSSCTGECSTTTTTSQSRMVWVKGW